MSGVVWTKFFWADWRSDPALRLCSHAAKGLWMDMLAIAAESDPIGHVMVNGRTLEIDDIAKMTGASLDDATTWVAELEKNGVFSRGRAREIISRRMIRDAKRAETGKKTGKMGGNPNLRKRKENEPTLNPRRTPTDNVGSGISQQPIANSHMPEVAASAATARAKPDDEVRIELRKTITEQFRNASCPTIPDTSHAGVWLAKGYKPDLIVAIIASALGSGKIIHNLKWFDKPMEEAHAAPTSLTTTRASTTFAAAFDGLNAVRHGEVLPPRSARPMTYRDRRAADRDAMQRSHDNIRANAREIDERRAAGLPFDDLLCPPRN